MRILFRILIDDQLYIDHCMRFGNNCYASAFNIREHMQASYQFAAPCFFVSRSGDTCRGANGCRDESSVVSAQPHCDFSANQKKVNFSRSFLPLSLTGGIGFTQPVVEPALPIRSGYKADAAGAPVLRRQPGALPEQRPGPGVQQVVRLLRQQRAWLGGPGWDFCGMVT